MNKQKFTAIIQEHMPNIHPALCPFWLIDAILLGEMERRQIVRAILK